MISPEQELKVGGIFQKLVEDGLLFIADGKDFVVVRGKMLIGFGKGVVLIFQLCDIFFLFCYEQVLLFSGVF